VPSTRRGSPARLGASEADSIFGISAARKREFHPASLPWAQIETKKPRCRPDRTLVPWRISKCFGVAMTLRVVRRPRALRTKRGPPCGRLGTGLRRRFPGRAEIAKDCEIRRPERQAMITVVVITTVVAWVHRRPVWGGLQWPHLQRPIRDPTRVRPVHARGCRQTDGLDAPPHGGLHSSNRGRRMSGREIASAAFCRSGTFLSSVIRETRSAATLLGPQHRDSDRAPAMPGLRHRRERLELGDITHPTVRVPFS
jgi:hypothetical protein